jgi:hypothetical protein
MGVIVTGHNSPTGFQNSEAVTVSNLNSHVNDSSFDTTAVDNSSIELTNNDQQLRLKDSSSTTTGTTLGKLQYIGTNKVLGRTSASDGVVEQLDIVGSTGVLLDEDTMTSNSAVKGASQQSIKSYVDNFGVKTTMLSYRGDPITLSDNDDGNTQIPLDFDHLIEAELADPDSNTTDINDCGVAFPSTNQFTLPEGTYDIQINAYVGLNTSNNNTPGLNAIGWLNRVSDNHVLFVTNVVEMSDSVSQRQGSHAFAFGRVKITATAVSNGDNKFDLRFFKDQQGTAQIGAYNAITHNPHEPAATVTITKVGT